MNNIFRRFKKFKKGEKGSVTIEASLVFPLIFLILVLFIFASIYIYQKVSLYYVASITAERATANWNDINKDPYTSAFDMTNENKDNNGGLYWRLTDDNILDLFFNRSSSTNASYNTSSQYSDMSLSQRKLQKASSILPDGITGTLTYHNDLGLVRKVTVTLERPLTIPILKHFSGDKVQVSAESNVTDPVEFIRNIDLIRTYSETLLKNKKTVDKWEEKSK